MGIVLVVCSVWFSSNLYPKESDRIALSAGAEGMLIRSGECQRNEMRTTYCNQRGVRERRGVEKIRESVLLKRLLIKLKTLVNQYEC